MFEIEEGKVALRGFNMRTEKHGDVDVLAADLDFTWETGNGCLAMFAPALRSCLYAKADDLVNRADPNEETATVLRFPDLAPLKWTSGEIVGATLLFHTGVSAKSNVSFDDCHVHKYRLECKEGGTVVVGFQVQMRPKEAEMGKLAKFFSDRQCVVSVKPPEPPGDLAR